MFIYINTIIITTMLLIISYLLIKPCEGYVFSNVKYIRNYDGDTVTFNLNNIHPVFGNNINIRLFGIDTAELNSKEQCEQNKARIAKNYVRKLLINSTKIDLKKVSRGKYFRIVADVIIDNKSLSAVLLERNLAYKYYGGKKIRINWCKL